MSLLNRKFLEEYGLHQLIRTNDPTVHVLSPEELEESRAEVLKDHPPGEDVWLFAYGSLIWNPVIHIAEQRAGRIEGYHRRFCLRTPTGRGSPQQPGLMLGLDSGGTCSGVFMRVEAAVADYELTLLWRREMITSAYKATWIEGQTEDGPVRAIAFVMNREHHRYTGRLSEAEIVESIALAEGPLGRCRDYLFNTSRHLTDLDICDHGLVRLCDAVRAFRSRRGLEG